MTESGDVVIEDSTHNADAYSEVMSKDIPGLAGRDRTVDSADIQPMY